MTERKALVDDSRKVIKIPADLHQAIDVESALTRTPMYALIQQAWDAYQRARGLQVPTEKRDEIQSGLTPRQVKLVTRYAELLRSGRDPEFAKVIETMLDRSEFNTARNEPERKVG